MIDNQTELMFLEGNDSQVKLKSVSVFNWGSFNGLHTLNINPEGTLITGENGSGKSTIIDALMTLLRPAGKIDYNIAAAQDQKKDRSLLSYMRGSFGTKIADGEQVSRNLRSDATVSVIKAVYEYASVGQKVVLLGIFYISSSSNVYSDVKKIYSVSSTDIDLKELLERFKNQDTRALKDYLRSIEGCRVCDDNFGEYETHFRHQLHMDNVNAPALLSRALGLKKIDDLTGLIRTLVLEPGTVKEDAQNTIRQFSDLKAIHAKLEDARKQEDKLSPLPDYVKKYEDNKALEEKYDKAITYTDTYVSRYAKDFYEKRCQELEFEYGNAQSLYKDLMQKKTEAESEKERTHTNLIKGGGDRAEQVKQVILQRQTEEHRIDNNLKNYSTIAKGLGLKELKSLSDFNDNLNVIEQKQTEIAALKEQNENKTIDLASKSSLLKQDISEYKSELLELEKHSDSNLSSAFLQLRDSISDDLGISADELVYVAELLEVKPSEERWHGAIERALGGIRQTLLVSDENYSLITKWVNSRHTGLHVRIQIASRVRESNVTFGNRGFLVKLNFKDHRYTEWLKQHLNKYDLICADSVEELNATEFSMTEEGLIHKSHGFFEKKDLKRIDDKREWCLGFSNKEKIKLLKQDLQKKENEVFSLNESISKLKHEKNSLENSTLACLRLKEFNSFNELDLTSIKAEIDKLKAALDTLIHDPAIAKLQQLYDDSVSVLNDIELKIREMNRKIGAMENDLDELKEKIRVNEENSLIEVPEETETLLLKTMTALKLTKDNVFVDANASKLRKELSDKRNRVVENSQNAQNKIISVISSFYSNEAWYPICADWGKDFDAYDHYLKHLENIQKEGLPKLVEEFKAKLNTEVTQSVACIVQKIDQELSSIKDRISQINIVLKRAEFTENSYLSIEPKKLTNPTLQEFDRDSRKVMNMLSLDDHELRYKAIEKVINTLTTALVSNAQEMKTVLDPRLRMQFLANVVDADTGEVKDTLNSSSGKSGGEKESFAGSVLAASLAYVLTPEGAQTPVYATVFLDEAFSNTSDKVSQRVLKIFHELGLHVNLITPFKNIELARDYAKSLVIMERNANTHSSSMCELSWQDYDEQLKLKKDQELLALGISVEDPETKDNED